MKLNSFFGLAFSVIFCNFLSAQGDFPVKHAPKPKEYKDPTEKNPLAEKLFISLPTDSLAAAGAILPGKLTPMIFTLKTPFEWNTLTADSVELYSLVFAGKRRILSARLFIKPTATNISNWHRELEKKSDRRLSADIEVDTSIKMNTSNLPFNNRPNPVKIKKMFGLWDKSYLETHVKKDTSFVIDVFDYERWNNFVLNNNKRFYTAERSLPAPDSIVPVTESPNCKNINDLYTSIRIPFEWKNKSIPRLYARLLVSDKGEALQLVFNGKVPALPAQSVVGGLSRLQFKPALKDGKPVPFWVTIPILFKK